MPRWLRFSLRSLLLLVLLIASAAALYVNWHPWQTIAILAAHNEPLHMAEFSPDGKRILTLCYEVGGPSPLAVTRVWDASTFKQSAQFSMPGDGNFLRSEFVAGGKLILSHFGEQSRLFDAITGRDLFDAAEKTTCFLSRDHRRCIVSYQSGRLSEVWDVDSLKPILALAQPPREESKAHISDDGRYVFNAFYATDDPDDLDCIGQLWDVDAGKVLFELRGKFDPSDRVQFLPGGRWAVSGDNVVVRDFAGKVLASFPGELPRVSLTEDGNTLAINDGLQTRLIDTRTLKQLHVLEGNVMGTHSHFSPDSTRILIHQGTSESKISNSHNILLFDMMSGSQLGKFDKMMHLSYAIWSTESVLIGRFPENCILNLKSGSVQKFPGWASAAPDFKRIAEDVGTVSVTVRDTLSNKTVDTLLGHSEVIRSVNWSPDSQRIITASADKTARVWQCRRPDTANGFLYLPELYLTAALAIALGWSIRRDWRG